MTYQRKGPHVLPYGDPLVFPCGHERTEANSLANGRGKPPRCKTCKLKSHLVEASEGSRMMSAPRNPVEIRQDVRRALTTVEAAALAHIEQQVAAGRQVTRADLCVAIGSQNYGGGTGPDILKRLESKGYITRNIYQRGVQVCLTETGLCSLPPKDTSPHWRLRADRVASPTPRAMRNRQPSLMQWAESFARTIDMPLIELLERACAAGLGMIRIEQSDSTNEQAA